MTGEPVEGRPPERPPAGAARADARVWIGWVLERSGILVEAVLYGVGGAFLIAAAIVVLADSLPILWQSGSSTSRALSVLDRMLVVFVLTEIFHTVRLAVSRHEIEPEPFLVVVIIAGVRRILVVTASEQTSSQRDLLELGLLVLLITASAIALVVLRRHPATRRERLRPPPRAEVRSAAEKRAGGGAAGG